MTERAQEFVRPLTFAALSGEKVITDLFSHSGSEETLQSAIEHIGVAQEADLLLVAPATADILAKFSHGIAGDFLTTMYLAFTGTGGGRARDEHEYVESSGHSGEIWRP